MRYLILGFISVLFISASGFANTNQNQEKSQAQPNTYLPYKILRVVDGDTFIAENDRIRLWGIDAPEKEDPLFDISKFALTKLLGKNVRCKHIELDKYKRNVMHCINDQGGDIGAAMVWTGFARDFQKYSGGFYNSEERFAKDNQLGIWKDKR